MTDKQIVLKTAELLKGFQALKELADEIAKGTWGHGNAEVEDAGCTFNYCIELAEAQADRIYANL